MALAYEVHGPAGAPDGPVAGPPLVLLHAFPLDRTLWRPVAQRLSGSLTSVLVDLPGLGKSALPDGEPSLDLSALALADTLDGLGVARAVIAGVSMGGYVAMAFARAFPGRVAGLGLVDTKASADPDEARANRLRMAEAVQANGSRVLLPMLDTLLGATSHASRPDLVATIRDAVLAAPAAGVAWSQRAMAARPDSHDVLAGLHVPAAVVVGEEDGLTNADAARAMATALPDAVLTVLPGAGHLAPVERPDAVADALLALVTRVRPAGPRRAATTG